MSGRRAIRNGKIATTGGEFVGARLTRKATLVTLWVEGRDQDGASVSGTGLTQAAVDSLITRLTNLREKMR